MVFTSRFYAVIKKAISKSEFEQIKFKKLKTNSSKFIVFVKVTITGSAVTQKICWKVYIRISYRLRTNLVGSIKSFIHQFYGPNGFFIGSEIDAVTT